LQKVEIVEDNTGLDFSNILGGKPKYYGRKRVVITGESIGVSQLLGACTRSASKVYAYGRQCL